MEPVYGTVIRLARLSWRIQGLKITVTGVDNLPTSGGAVVAINHTSYLDFTFAGLPAYQQGLGRKVRFMAKQEVFDHKITGPIMRSLRHIPVDRQDGSASYDAAVRMLKAGELVGVYPEATISRSFEIKEFKTGAARMAIEAGVPIVPHIVWGAQRIWTKDRPKKLFRPKVPVTIVVGERIEPTLPTAELNGQGKQPLDSGHGRALLSIFVGAHETENTSCWSSLAGPRPTHRIEAAPCGVVHNCARDDADHVAAAQPNPQRVQCQNYRGASGSAAIMAGDVRRYTPMQNHDYVTYEEFGRRFFEVAVTPDRVAAAFADIAGSEFAMEPISQGPGGIAKVSANVKIREPRVTRKLGDLITFVIHIPLSIDLLLDLRLDKQRFMVAGDIALRATARAAEPLLLIVDVAKPRPSDITVNVSSKSIRGEVLRILAGVDGEIRRFIAQYVSAEIDSPKSQAAQVINVAEQLDSTWSGP